MGNETVGAEADHMRDRDVDGPNNLLDPMQRTNLPLFRLLCRAEARILLTVLGAMLTMWFFYGVADDVQEGDTAQVDRRILLAFRRAGDLATPIGPRWVQESARDFTALGGFTTLTLVTFFAVAVLWLLRRRTQAVIFGATVTLTQAGSELVKAVIDRPRPEIVPQQDLVYSASFPSGHAMMAPVVYLSLAAILAAGHRRLALKGLLLSGAVLLVLTIGVSRVYLGVHWPSDVLAGWTLGTGIALLASFGLYRSAPRQGSDQIEPSPTGAKSVESSDHCSRSKASVTEAEINSPGDSNQSGS